MGAPNPRLRSAERRALRLPAVKLCKRLRYEGWEHLHGATRVLLSPAGSPRVARRVVELFLDGREAVDPAEAPRDQDPAGVWMTAEPEERGRWVVRFLPGRREA